MIRNEVFCHWCGAVYAEDDPDVQPIPGSADSWECVYEPACRDTRAAAP